MVRQLVRSALAGSSPRLLATVGGLLLLGALLVGLSRPAQLRLVSFNQFSPSCLLGTPYRVSSSVI